MSELNAVLARVPRRQGLLISNASFSSNYPEKNIFCCSVCLVILLKQEKAKKPSFTATLNLS